MTTKGQMSPTSRVSVTASQAEENSQTNGLEHTIVFIILTDLIFKRTISRPGGTPGWLWNLRPESTGPNHTTLRSSPDYTVDKPTTRWRRVPHGLGPPAAGIARRTYHGYPSTASVRPRQMPGGPAGASHDSDTCPDKEWTQSPKQDTCKGGTATGQNQSNWIGCFQAPEARRARGAHPRPTDSE